MEHSVEQALEAVPFCFGQISVRKSGKSFVLCHRDDDVERALTLENLAALGAGAQMLLDAGALGLRELTTNTRDDLETFRNAEDAIEIARNDDAGNYRPLKTAPDLRHGWRMELRTSDDLKRALDHFYPGRLGIFIAWKAGRLRTTPLRETLDRQSGMYRIAAKISDAQINDLVADFCRSNGGCLRTILWKRDQRGAIASAKLPKQKFDPSNDQTRALSEPGSPTPATGTAPATVPLLCQEPCNLLVAACRKVVKGE